MTPRPPLNPLIESMSPVARKVMLQYFTPDCCIATCRVLRSAFGIFGYLSDAVPVSVFIFNRNMATLLRDGVVIPTEMEQRRKLLDKHGAWSVGITKRSATVGSTVPEGRFGGHLVLRVMNTLVDGSLQQANRPQHKIVLPPLIAFTPDKPVFFTQKRTRGKRCGVTVNDCEVVYQRLGDYSFRTAPDWIRVGSPYDIAVRRIVAETSERLQERLQTKEVVSA
jgi:hypothetical protein